MFTHNQKSLARTLFPLAEFSKTEVRQLARHLGIHVAEKSESQEICFISGHYYDYINQSRQLSTKIGDIRHINGKTLGSHGGLTDKGWHHFEETHHIPFIMRMPGAQKAARRIDKLISLADVYPTILKLAGSNVPEGGHGASLLPVIDGKCSDDWREYVVTEFNGLANSLITQRTLRCGDWKYGFNNSGEDELYNLAIDPWEMKNIINDSSVEKQLTELMKHLLTWMEETNDPVINRFKFLRHQKLGIETRATV